MSKVDILGKVTSGLLFPAIAVIFGRDLYNAAEHEYRKPTHPGPERQITYAGMAMNVSIITLCLLGTAQTWSSRLRENRRLAVASNLSILPFLGACGYYNYLGLEQKGRMQITKDKVLRDGLKISTKKTVYTTAGANGPIVYTFTRQKSAPVPSSQ